MWLIEGLEGGRWALVVKLHHCMADGVDTIEMMDLLLDHTAAERQAEAEPPPWPPEPEPSALPLMLGGVRDAVADSIRRVVGIPAFARGYW